jgi:hypothetical protein
MACLEVSDLMSEHSCVLNCQASCSKAGLTLNAPIVNIRSEGTQEPIVSVVEHGGGSKQKPVDCLSTGYGETGVRYRAETRLQSGLTWGISCRGASICISASPIRSRTNGVV